MRLLRTVFPVLLVALLASLAAGPAVAVEHTIWHSPLLLRADENSPSLAVVQGIPAASVDVTSSLVGDHSVLVPLTIPATVSVRRVQLCYRVSDEASYVDLIRLTRMTTPASATVYLDDGTNRNSTVHACEETPSNNYPVDGTYTLQLRLHFASTAHTVETGAIGIVVEPVASSAPIP